MNNFDTLDGSSFVFNKKPKKLIFLLHGYGDNAENFIPLAKYLNDSTMEANFFAPNAPFSVSQYPTGRQWFNPYPNGIHYNEAGLKEKAIMQEECKASINKLKEYINDYCLLNDLTHRDCFLIGFSQGAMIAYELGNFIRKTFAGCVMLSGRILLSRSLDNNFFIKTPLMIVHGDTDDIVNPVYFTEACKITKSCGFIVEKHLMNGEGHTISSKTLKLVQNFLKKYM